MVFDWIGILLLVFVIFRSNRLQKISHCMVVSEPEGAEIFVEGQSVGTFTPGLVQMDLDREVRFTLKKNGYESKTVVVKSQSQLSFFYTELEKNKLRLVSDESVQGLGGD